MMCGTVSLRGRLVESDKSDPGCLFDSLGVRG